ncbi:hypothetical protein RIF29_24202 [Crotalaria pallida]|uniref:AT-hook motif nuclear-localized protein n=1 Tax=Crotalaria pallida TaxID=3830 RepID=A0AAN9EK38_CROPI
MEGNDNIKVNINNTTQFSSYYHHTTTTNTTTTTTTSTPNNNSIAALYPHSVPSSSATEPPAKRKRGRPRKYSAPPLQQLPPSNTTPSLHSPNTNIKKQLQHASPSPSAYSYYSPNKSSFNSFSLGNAGQGFTPHVISVAAGEDVGQKIMLFMQQSRREMCILSASGSISNASLRQPATTGSNITYEGRFEIISLSGSYVRNEVGGRSGGLSVCLSNTDGQIIGGGVGGPLKAAGPVQVIVGTFFVDTKKDTGASVKGDASASKLPSPVVESVSFHHTVDTSGRNPIRGNDEHQAIGGSHFMVQQLGLHATPSRSVDWGPSPDSRNTGYDLTGRTGLGAQHQSPENGGYEQIPD